MNENVNMSSSTVVFNHSVSVNDTDKVEIKIGVLLPTELLNSTFTTNNNNNLNHAMAGIQLAIDEINASDIIPGAYLSVMQKGQSKIPTALSLQQQSYQQISNIVTQAVIVPTLSLIQEDGVVGVISGDASDLIYSTDSLSISTWTTVSALLTSSLEIPHCSFSATALSLSDKSQYGSFFRTAPTDLLHIDAIMSFMQSQNWTTFGILYSDTDSLGRLMTQVIASKCKQKSSPLSLVSYRALTTSSSTTTTFSAIATTKHNATNDYDTEHIHDSIDHVMSLGARIIVIVTEDIELTATTLLMAVLHKHLNKETAWLALITDDEKNDSDSSRSSAVLQQRLESLVNEYNEVIQQRISMSNNNQAVMAVKDSSATPKMWKRNDTNSLLPGPLNNKNKSVIGSLAWKAKDLSPLNYSALFPGGVFAFQATRKDLVGYPPFEKFKDAYNKRFNTDSISSSPDYYRSGLAYSCLMAMAHGFAQVVNNAKYPKETLRNLTTGEGKRGESLLSNYEIISLFNNTDVVGPQGPVLFNKEGDITTGNFKIFNIQNGLQVEIGKVVGGEFGLSRSPVFSDGSSTPPVGKPPIIVLVTGLTTPIAKTTAALTIVGILTALFILFTIIIKRRHPVFRSASVSFCIVELVGFLLSYTSILLIFKGSMCLVTCYLKPISFYLAYSILICTMLARNYKVYKTMNNVFAKEAFMTDSELLRLISYVFTLNMSVMVLWLASTTVELSEVSVSTSNVFIKTCNYYHDPNSDERQHEAYFNHSFLVVILTILAGIELGICVFMTMRTKSFGGYSKYSEHKQLGLSVYNIFFSAVTGFIIFFMPTNDFYTRHYLTAMTILWATTFSMAILFFPKLYKLYSSSSSGNKTTNTLSRSSKVNCNQRKRSFPEQEWQQRGEKNTYSRRRKEMYAGANADKEDKMLMTLNQFLATDQVFPFTMEEDDEEQHESSSTEDGCIDDDTTMRSVTMVGSSNTIKTYDIEDAKQIPVVEDSDARKEKLYVQWFEDVLPVQQTFKAFPSFLARWEMQRIVLYPQFSLLLCYSSENGCRDGIQFEYSHASIVTKASGDYVLKIHSCGVLFNLLVQVGSEAELYIWCSRFNDNLRGNTKPLARSG